MADSFSALIEKSCDMDGNFAFNGNVRIAGKVSGQIFCNQTIFIAKGAEVKASIEADAVVLEGNLIGDIQANARVEIKEQAYFEGSIKSNSLIIEEGATFKGTSETV